MKLQIFVTSSVLLFGCLLLVSATSATPFLSWMTIFGFPPNRHFFLGSCFIAMGVLGILVLWIKGAFTLTKK